MPDGRPQAGSSDPRSGADLALLLLAAQRRALAMIATGRPLPEVLAAIVDSVEQDCHGTIASVLILDADRQHLRHGAAPGLPEEYNNAIDGVRIGPAVGSCGTAAYRGERVVSKDIATDPLWADYRGLAERHGLKACWSQPFFSSNHKVLGTFAMYYRESREPSAADLEFIEAAAHLAAIAIERERTERSRQEASRRLLSQSTALVELARSEDLAQSDFPGFTRLATEVAAATLGVERVGVWFFSEDREVLRCRDLYQISLDRHTEGVEIPSHSYPRYFAALERGRVVASHDARVDLDTSEFTNSYLDPIGITSMLDAPVRKEGILVGVVCHEHVGHSRVWAADEQDFAASVADFVSLALEAGDRRRAEQAFRVAQEELLRQQWQARTQVESELTRVEAELVRSTRLATIGQIAASIAHELRNPLAAIRNAEFYLKRHVPDHEARCREHLEIIGQEIHAADGIIDNLLEMTRAKEPERRSVDLGAAVREAFGRVKESRGVRLSIDLRPDPFLIEADPDQLRQLLVNLITNSAQALDGNGEIRVCAVVDGSGTAISVIDDGPGVSEEHRDRIFEPLYSTKHKGTGLGLTISSQIAERHGWRLDLQTVDRGAAFRILIPRTPPR